MRPKDICAVARWDGMPSVAGFIMPFCLLIGSKDDAPRFLSGSHVRRQQQRASRRRSRQWSDRVRRCPRAASPQRHSRPVGRPVSSLSHSETPPSRSRTLESIRDGHLISAEPSSFGSSNKRWSGWERSIQSHGPGQLKGPRGLLYPTAEKQGRLRACPPCLRQRRSTLSIPWSRHRVRIHGVGVGVGVGMSRGWITSMSIVETCPSVGRAV